MKRLSIGLFILIALLLTACGEEGSEANGESDDSLSIYTTLYPLAYFADEIGGDDVEVSTILPAGADPHNFEPTSKMMVEIATADLFVFNGANLEAYAGEIEEALQGEDVKMIEAAEGIDLEEHVHEHEHDHGDKEGHDHEHSHETEEAHDHAGHDHGDVDPHVWLDPIKAVQLAENIKDALVEIRPEQKESYEENFQDLEERLTALDQSFHEQLEQSDNKEILVTHAAYGYWEQGYGIEQIAISGLSPTDEPSQKQLEEIIHQVDEKGIKYLLFEQNVEPKVAKVIQNEANIESLQLHNLSVLTEEDIEKEENYFTLMERNLEVLEQALHY